MSQLTIGRPVGPAHKLFISAEMSGNYNQRLERTLALVDAAEAGVDALKLYLYTTDALTMDTGFALDEEGQRLWEGKTATSAYFDDRRVRWGL